MQYTHKLQTTEALASQLTQPPSHSPPQQPMGENKMEKFTTYKLNSLWEISQTLGN